MIGSTIVETEYIGTRSHFRTSYFASLKQILIGFGGLMFSTGLIACDAVAMSLSLLDPRITPPPKRGHPWSAPKTRPLAPR